MKIIQCAESCVYQEDGYCCLEEISVVNTVNSICPHYIEKSSDKGNGFSQSSHSD